MPRRKCTQKQLEALRRGREKRAHKRSKKNTKGSFGAKIIGIMRKELRPPSMSGAIQTGGILRPSARSVAALIRN